jgi:hypothetical protein
MKIIIILFSTLLFTFTTYATNCNKEGAHSHDEITTNGLSSGQITDNIININVNNKELNKITNIFMFSPFKNV